MHPQAAEWLDWTSRGAYMPEMKNNYIRPYKARLILNTLVELKSQSYGPQSLSLIKDNNDQDTVKTTTNLSLS